MLTRKLGVGPMSAEPAEGVGAGKMDTGAAGAAVLVVEDHELLAQSLIVSLGAEGFEVKVASIDRKSVV